MNDKKDHAQWLLDTMQSFFSNNSSIEVTKTSRGNSWKIKCYNTDPIVAFEKNKELYKLCEKEYGDAD